MDCLCHSIVIVAKMGINMKSNTKIDQNVLPARSTREVQQVREISKEELKEISGGCGDMGGVVVIRF